MVSLALLRLFAILLLVAANAFFVAAEFALVSDTADLGKQRTKEKKAMQRRVSKREPGPEQEAPLPPSVALDEETERVLRFLHG